MSEEAEEVEMAGHNSFRDWDGVYAAISNERRRFVLRYLNEHGSTPLDELAVALVDYEEEERWNAQDRKGRYVTLYQCHLPKLYECGLVDYEDKSGTIHPDGPIDEVVEAMDVIEGIGEEGDRSGLLDGLPWL